MKPALAIITISTLLLLGSPPVLALDPSLEVSKYAHTAWTARDGFSLGKIYTMAQTPDGYLWFGKEFGLVRDNGKGIDPQLISRDDGREGHFGLRGMRERAKLIGGELTVWSELDSGTEVELSIPAARAYLAAVERRRSGLVEKLAGKFSGKDPELKA